MSEVLARLESAIGTGELVSIVYHGGSQPGAFREITPLQIEDGKVRARCYTSNAVKTFALDKIELRGPIPTPNDEAKAWNPLHRPTLAFYSIEQMHERLKAGVGGPWLVRRFGNL